MKSPRALAAEVLAKWTHLNDPPAVPERGDSAWAALEARDRAFAFDLITGVIRWRGTLDAVLAGRLTAPMETLELKVRAVLWIGAYQTLLHSGIQDYAAVDSSVELVREVDVPRAATLVNAVLRGITRLAPKVEPRKELSRYAFPRDFTTQVKFSVSVFPDPVRNCLGHLAAVTSHPRELVEALVQWHSEAVATQILIRNNQRPAVILRADDAGFAPPWGSGLVPHEEAGYFVAADGWNEVLEALVTGGTVSPQDPTAGKVARRAAVAAPGARRVLDLCAGMGTKAIQMARLWPAAEIVASDIDMAKLAKLRDRAKKVGAANVKIVPAKELSGKFDVVLADVPCSNTGVMARRVQSRWRWPTLDLARLQALQVELLSRGRSMLAGGGVLAYATCSIDPRENARLVNGFFHAKAGMTKLVEELTLPAFSDDPRCGHDGGYLALLRA